MSFIYVSPSNRKMFSGQITPTIVKMSCVATNMNRLGLVGFVG